MKKMKKRKDYKIINGENGKEKGRSKSQMEKMKREKMIKITSGENEKKKVRSKS
jgi:hypothetical protein